MAHLSVTQEEAYPDNLICAAQTIFDRSSFRCNLEQELKGVSSAKDTRAVTTKHLNDARQRAFRVIAKAHRDSPFSARPVTRAYSWLTDQIVSIIFDVACKYLHPNSTPTQSEYISFIAVGGYGRGEMAPYSDVDLLFVTPYKITPWAESVIESTLYMLWDLKLKVGHASRTLEECLRLAKEDFTIRTSLLECRFLKGNAALYERLNSQLWTELFHISGPEFTAEKLRERDLRHEKQGQRYVVEPNIKEGKGGLRDLQSMFWIAKYLHGVKNAKALVGLGVFRLEEFQTFKDAEDFLWAVRCHLHRLVARANEKLTFDHQVDVAKIMGYEDKCGRRAVEYFMQDYFRHATYVGDLTRVFLTALEANQVSYAPLPENSPDVYPPYIIKNNRLTVFDYTAFFSDKLNMLRIIEEALRTGALLHPSIMREITWRLDLIDDAMRESEEAQAIFMNILIQHGNPDRGLRRMNELGLLAAFIPDFAPVVAMMQFNMYHHYTVDEHTIQCINHLSKIEHGELVEELPVVSQILENGVNRRVLYVALLLHDIGKGRDEDHSVLGAKIARKLAPRLGLNKEECATVEWLVRQHLLLSDTAQKRDITEPRTVRGFAHAVKTVERLDLLTVLTVCDIRGVGPDTWNNWKAVLIRNLYGATRHALENGIEELNRKTRGQDARTCLKKALSSWSDADIEREIMRHYGPYWQGLPCESHVIFATLLNGFKDRHLEIDVKLDPDRDATRACFVMVDHPGLFSRMTGALALVGANVVDARSYTTKDGYATAVFWVQDDCGSPYEQEKLPKLCKMIEQTLKGEVIASEAIKSRDVIKKRERAFRVPTLVSFDNEGSEIYTIIEIESRDRPGLLYDLTRTLSHNSVYIASAVIATYGEQVVDTFYVKDMFGQKYMSETQQTQLIDKLKHAIKQGTQRANT